MTTPMSFKLFQLAPGSYDVVLNGVIIGGLVRSESASRVATWTAELLVDLPHEERPAPFTELEHQFGTLEEARVWLGNPIVHGQGRASA